MQSIYEVGFMDMKLHGNLIKFRIEADGFLKYMVRNIIGCVVEIGSGKLSCEDVVEAFQSGKRPSFMQTAPASGVFLEKIVY